MSEPPNDCHRPPPAVHARPLAYARHLKPPDQLTMPSVSRRDALLDACLILLAMLVLPYLPEVLAPAAAEATEPSAVGALIIIRKWCEATVAMGLLLYLVLRHRTRAATFGLRGDHMGGQLLWALAALFGVYIANIAMAIPVVVFYLLFPKEAGPELSQRVQFVEAMPLENLLATLALLIPVAIHEEIVFRGLLLPCFRRGFGNWPAALAASAGIFAALHVPTQGLLAGFQVFGIGLALGLFFVLSRSLLATMVAHLLFDFLQFQIARLLPDLQQLLHNVQGQ